MVSNACMSNSLGKLKRTEEGIHVGSIWELLLAENADLRHIRPSQHSHISYLHLIRTLWHNLHGTPPCYAEVKSSETPHNYFIKKRGSNFL